MVHEFGNGLCVLLTVASLRIQLVRLMDELAALQQTFLSILDDSRNNSILSRWRLRSKTCVAMPLMTKILRF